MQHKKTAAPIVLATLIFAMLPASATILEDPCLLLGTVDTDQWDTDGDDLSDCLEEQLLGTNPSRIDTDEDSIDDRYDLNKGTGDVPITVHVAKLREDSKKCDGKGARYWDPFVATGFISVPLQSGDRQGQIIKGSYTKSTNTHDVRTHHPADLSGKVDLPEDFRDFSYENLFDMPFGSLTLGFKDEDTVFNDAVSFGSQPSTSLDTSFPLSLTWDGEHAVVGPITGSEGRCRGEIILSVDTSVSLDQMITGVLARTGEHDLITYDMVTNHRGSPEFRQGDLIEDQAEKYQRDVSDLLADHKPSPNVTVSTLPDCWTYSGFTSTEASLPPASNGTYYVHTSLERDGEVLDQEWTRVQDDGSWTWDTADDPVAWGPLQDCGGGTVDVAMAIYRDGRDAVDKVTDVSVMVDPPDARDTLYEVVERVEGEAPGIMLQEYRAAFI